MAAQKVTEFHSAYNDCLEIWLQNGTYLLDSKSVNYSFGGLHTAFAETFAEIELSRLPFKNALVLGLGAGSVPFLLRQAGLTGLITGVELDPVVVEIGKQYFNIQAIDGLNIVEADAVEFVRTQNEETRWDLIVSDLFIDKTVPPEAETAEFLGDLSRLLSPQGLLIYNRIRIDAETTAATDRFAVTFAQVFPRFVTYQTDINKMFMQRLWRELFA